MCTFECTISSKINGTLKGIYSPISKLHSILSVAHLLAHNNITISYYGQVNSRGVSDVGFSIFADTDADFAF